ncbi:hypothetical protein ACFQ0B_55825 [Nonomuraea thailandensis]
MSCEHLPGVTLVRVAGEADALNAAQLETFLAHARRRPASRWCST